MTISDQINAAFVRTRECFQNALTFSEYFITLFLFKFFLMKLNFTIRT